MHGPRTTAAACLILAVLSAPAAADPADDVHFEEDTMIVVDQDALPEDIINVIRLPDAARGRNPAAMPIDARRRGREAAEPATGANARDAAAEIAEQARGRGAEASDDARERAADIAESMREAAEEMREEVTPPRGPPPDRDLPEQAEGPP